MFAFWKSLPRSGKLAVGLWVALVVGVSGRVALSKPASQSVVPIYRTAGEQWLAGENIYALVPGQDVYRNPPGIAAFFAPVALLPEKTGAILWRLGTASLFLYALTRFRRDVLPDLSPERAGGMFALAALLALPAVNNGQLNLVLAAVGLGGAAAIARGNWWAAAGWLSVGGWVKIYPLAVGMLLAAAYPKKLAGRLAVVLVAGFALPFVLQDPGYVADQYRGFAHELGEESRMTAGPERVPRDWTCVARSWLNWVPSDAVVKLTMLATAVGCGAIVLGARLFGVETRSLLFLTVTVGSTWMTVFGPATEAHTYVILAGTAAAAAVLPMNRWATATVWLGCGLMVAVVLRPMFPNDWKFTLLGPQAVGAVLVAAAVSWQLAPRVAPVTVARGKWNPIPSLLRGHSRSE